MKGWNGLLYFLLSLSCALICLNSTKVLFPYILLTMQWVHTNIKLYTNISVLPISTWIGHLTKHGRYSICLCKIHTYIHFCSHYVIVMTFYIKLGYLSYKLVLFTWNGWEGTWMFTVPPPKYRFSKTWELSLRTISAPKPVVQKLREKRRT